MAKPGVKFTKASAVRIAGAVRRVEGVQTAGNPNTPQRPQHPQDDEVGTAIVTTAITAAVYGGAAGAETIELGEGFMKELFQVAGAGNEETLQVGGLVEPVFTIADATTPAGKYIHWHLVEGRKHIWVEPC
jgi:hypothetical protein